eukprot:scaffold282555_cov46-Prasinocladus_malaysianus.AAC.1
MFDHRAMENRNGIKGKVHACTGTSNAMAHTTLINNPDGAIVNLKFGRTASTTNLNPLLLRLLEI